MKSKIREVREALLTEGGRASKYCREGEEAIVARVPIVFFTAESDTLEDRDD
jgi:hypothetical protein